MYCIKKEYCGKSNYSTRKVTWYKKKRKILLKKIGEILFKGGTVCSAVVLLINLISFKSNILFLASLYANHMRLRVFFRKHFLTNMKPRISNTINELLF